MTHVSITPPDSAWIDTTLHVINHGAVPGPITALIAGGVFALVMWHYVRGARK